MGVAGCGKTSVAQAISEITGARLGEADELHPASNIDKMSRGIPLTDDDRGPWLEDIARWLAAGAETGIPGVIACSALKRRYRDVLRSGGAPIFFVHLRADRDLIAVRMNARTDHFMPTSLLDSQFAILERLQPGEIGIELEALQTPADLARAALDASGLHTDQDRPTFIGGPA
ncbi:gluconokinase [Rhodococcus sp. NPDC127530]|uniref:gluconokinase n=1 Tax=unclassified Rhodococcus (in: high G+C Gram-positive bacteria) TaxID=192944 RepID=UPI0036385DC7